MPGIFHKCVFYVGHTKDIKEKKAIINDITSNGGEITYGVSSKTTHLIANEKDILECAYVIKSSFKYGCWIVLPSFIYDSLSIGRREKEWNHTIINNKRAHQLADTEEEFLLSRFEKAINNITNISVVVDDPIQVFKKGIRNIAAVAACVISKRDDIKHYGNTSLIDALYRWIPDPNAPPTIESSNSIPSKTPETRLFAKSYVSQMKEPTSSLLKKKTETTKSSFYNPNLKSNELSFMERTALKRREREEKLKQMEEERKKKEAERRIKEEERIKKAEERLKKLEEDKLRIEEAKKRRDELFEMNTRIGFNAAPLEAPDWMLELDKDREEYEKKREQERQLKLEKQKKLEKKQKKEQKKKEKIEYISKKHSIIKERQLKREEELRRKKEEEENLKIEKERRRKEYKERLERKRQRILNGEIIESQTPVKNDDRKLFIGAINFKDLENKEKLSKLPSTLTSEMIQKIKIERIKNYWEIFEKFGPVEKRKNFIEKGSHCFIIYKDSSSVDKAFEALSQFEDRKRICGEYKEKLTNEGGKMMALQAPSPHFYVRRVHSSKKPRHASNSSDAIAVNKSRPEIPITSRTEITVEDDIQMIGETLYPLIVSNLNSMSKDDNLAGKITGMILEASDINHLSKLIQSPKALLNKVKEALEVLLSE